MKTLVIINNRKLDMVTFAESKVYLEEKFKEITGVSYTEYINSIYKKENEEDFKYNYSLILEDGKNYRIWGELDENEKSKAISKMRDILIKSIPSPYMVNDKMCIERLKNMIYNEKGEWISLM